mgnify:CR=1 FL=1
MSSSYTSNFKVRLDDLDYMGIVGNAQWLIFLERTRIELLEALGFPFADMQKKGVGGVVARAEVNYLRPARFGDVLSVQTTPKVSGESSVQLSHSALSASGKEFIRAEISIVFVGSDGRPVSMPPEVKSALERG